MLTVSAGRVVAAAAIAVAAASVPASQEPDEPIARFAGGVGLVEVYVTVTDAAGVPIGDLTAGDFEVRENGVLQTVSVFAAEDVPLAVALGVDRSWSMSGEPLRLARVAAERFLRDLAPADRSMVLSIGSEAEVIAPLSTDRPAQIRAVQAMDLWGTTALHDAIVAGLDRLAPEPGRQALVVFSDGTDRYSRTSEADLLARVRRSAALVYPVAVGRTRPRVLVELATLSGARSVHVTSVTGLAGALQSIAAELRSQYLLGYVPARPMAQGRGEWRSIDVRLARAPRGARVRARDGYMAD